MEQKRTRVQSLDCGNGKLFRKDPGQPGHKGCSDVATAEETFGACKDEPSAL